MTRVLWLGAYHRDAERNVILLRGLAENGVAIIERHFSMAFLRFRGSGLAGQLARALIGLPRHSIRLTRAARAARDADAVFIGYLGHLDMAILSLLRPFIGPLRRKPLVFDPFFSLYDTVVSDRGLLAERSSSARLLKAAERFLFRHADRVLADTAAHAAYYANLSGLPPERFFIVPVGMDDALFTPRASTPSSDMLQVLFYGSYIPLHGIPTILEAARLLRREPIRFRLIGRGQTRTAADSYADEQSLMNVEFVDQVSRRALPDEIAQADLILGIFGTSDKAARVIPNKVYQAMAVGRCVITRDSPAIREAFVPGTHLVTCPAGDPGALASVIHDLAADAARRAAIGQAATALVQEGFCCAAIGRALIAALTTAPPGGAAPRSSK